MNLSIVIPAFNEEKFLPATLAAIRRSAEVFDAEGWNWELVVCDNNSRDRTADVAREWGARVVHEPVNQIGRARNTGAADARGDWLLFIDADSEPNQGVFRRTLEYMRDDAVIGGGCMMVSEGGGWFLTLLTEVWNTCSRAFRLMAGSYIFVRSEAFRKVGGFDLKRYAGEEIVLSNSLKRLARERRQRLVIISDERLVTSARKIHLFSKREQLAHVLRGLRAPLHVIHRPQPWWYDGRR